MNTPYKALGYIFFVALVVLMVVPSGWNYNQSSLSGIRADYLLHVFVYLPWVFVGKIFLKSKLNSYLWLFLGLIAVVGLECLQILIAYRGYSVYDVIAGAIGVIASFVLFNCWERIFRK